MQAVTQKTAAKAHPKSRGPTALGGWATATGNTNIKRAAVDAPAIWGDTIPTKRTQNPTTAIRTTAATLSSETTVPKEIRQLPTSTNAR
jgi:hypothetical protein